MVKKIQNNDMSEILEQSFAVLDFSATWCNPCKMLAPVLEQVAEEMEGQATFYNIDCDENPELATKFKVYSIPCLVALKNGEPVGQTVGFLPKAELETWIKSF